MRYRVQQKATIWYETYVDADSPDHAIEITRDPATNRDLDWWQVDDSTDMLNKYWWSDENEDEGELGDEDE